jgi:hypothetical protein
VVYIGFSKNFGLVRYPGTWLHHNTFKVPYSSSYSSSVEGEKGASGNFRNTMLCRWVDQCTGSQVMVNYS